MDDDKSFGAIILLVAFIVGLGSICITKSIDDRYWTQEVVKRNAAEYNPTTGVFQWKR